MFCLGECMWWFLNKFFQKMPKIADYLARIVVYIITLLAGVVCLAHYLKKDYLKNYFVLFWDNAPNRRKGSCGKQIAMATIKTQKTKVKKLYFMPYNYQAKKESTFTTYFE